MFRRHILLLVAQTGTLQLLRAEPAGGIPDSLLRNSDAVVRRYDQEFVYHSLTSADEKCIQEITILNKSGASKSYFSCYTDRTRSLRSFSGAVYDEQGKLIRKLKRSDLQYTEYSSSSLAQDGAVYYLQVDVPQSCYTVRFEHEIAHRNGILTFPVFLPQSSTATALLSGSYTITLPRNTPFGWKSLRAGEPEHDSTEETETYRWRLEGVPAVCSETSSPPLIDLVPVVYAVPHRFEYEKTQGSMENWESYGRWQCSLLEGRDLLPEELRAEVHRRTDALGTPREKVRALYDYLGETTRYVSIQLGIGGLQPMPAEEVFRTKFGDCKALSNYLKAMLAECGIASDYTMIHTQRPRMFRDFTSPAQADHVILRVPLEGDTLWLECTNPEIPFGYVHNTIAGHDAIAFHDNTAEFVTLPTYADSLNRMEQTVEVTLDDRGGARGHIAERYEVGQYESVMTFAKLDARRRSDFLLSDLRKLPLVRLATIACTELKEALPAIEFAYDIDAPKYGTLSGNRLFVPLTPFADYGTLADRERQNPIYRAEGYDDVTTIRLRIPEGMTVESVPKQSAGTSPFGSFSTHITTEEGCITVVLRTRMHAGLYPPEMFDDYRKFIDARSRAFNARLVLKRE